MTLVSFVAWDRRVYWESGRGRLLNSEGEGRVVVFVVPVVPNSC